MMKKYTIITFVLILIIAFLVMENYKEWTKPAPAAKENVLSKQKPTVLPAVSQSGAVKKEVPAPASFKSVSDKNIFSPDRKEFPIPLVTEAKKPPPVRPNLQLFGVAVGEGFKSAVITNPTRRPNERETMTVREGDRVAEYKVANIVDDRLTLESSGDSFDVLLYDPSKQKKRPVVASTPSPTPVQPPSVPPRPYTSPGAVPAPSTSPPAVQPGGFPRSAIGTQPIQRTVPAVSARTVAPPTPEPDEEDDDEN